MTVRTKGKDGFLSHGERRLKDLLIVKVEREAKLSLRFFTLCY